ncbi:MAG: hypothetical protein Q8R18_03620, partial [bacterium]|nr:hypothetical protein [bacterium]
LLKYLSIPSFLIGSGVSLLACNQFISDLCQRHNDSLSCTYEEKGEIIDMLKDVFTTEVYSYVSPSLEARVIINDREGIEIDSISDAKRTFGFGCNSDGSCTSVWVYSGLGCTRFNFLSEVYVCDPSNPFYQAEDPRLIKKSLEEAYRLAIEQGEKYSESRVVLESLDEIFNPE